MLLTKISALRDPEDIETIGTLGPTYMTFDFYSLSLRYMGEVDASIFNKIPAKTRRTGRFVDQHTLIIVAQAGKYGLTTVELDGNENAAQCEELSAEGLEVLKTIRPKDFPTINQYEGVCNRLIFKDIASVEIEKYNGRTPFLICTDTLVKVNNPMFCGADTGEGLECEVGCKDINAVREFINHYRYAPL